MEANGESNRIHISQSTAELIESAGKGAWLQKRADLVEVKGKGFMQTYFLEPSSLEHSSSNYKSEGDPAQMRKVWHEMFDEPDEQQCRNNAADPRQ